MQVLYLFAQTPLKLDTKSSMAINGTSTLHNWESEVSNFVLTGIGTEKDGKVDIQALTLTVPVKSIKSGKSLMDEKTYEALLADKFPNIKFVLESAQLVNGQIKGKGKLSIAGKTKEVPFMATYSKIGSSTLDVRGSQKIDMLSFGVEPPSVLMGSISTGKDVTIPYHLIISF